ncbi:hypothetical protein LTR50_005722 [Elasticomyces elasticus]|nr:hypothetical protein LTR50_005722 [Elasticomyces elasticus]
MPDHWTTAPSSLRETVDPADASLPSKPPPLNYTLRTRKLSILIFWTLIVLDWTIMPIALYFGLSHGTNLSPDAVSSIVTAALGGVSAVEYFLRFWRLWKQGSTCRVLGARRAYLDWFHWTLSLAWVIVMIELIVGTVPVNPRVRLLAMPLASFVFVVSTELLVIDVARLLRARSPVRISSLPSGAPLRPGVYFVVEDVVAVDGGGGTEFRADLNRRFEASPVFRQMLHRLTFFWAMGGEVVAVLTTVLVFTIQREAAYCVGWTVPFIWAGMWTLITIMWVQRGVREEQRQWSQKGNV